MRKRFFVRAFRDLQRAPFPQMGVKKENRGESNSRQ
jgi:hypothetical protein